MSYVEQYLPLSNHFNAILETISGLSFINFLLGQDVKTRVNKINCVNLINVI